MESLSFFSDTDIINKIIEYAKSNNFKFIFIGCDSTNIKNKILKRIQAEYSAKDETELIYSYINPNEVEALVLYKRKTIILNNNYISNHLDNYITIKIKQSNNKSEIKLLHLYITKLKNKISNYFRTLGIIDNEINSYIDKSILDKKIDRFILRNIIRRLTVSSKPEYKERILGTVSDKGIRINYNIILNTENIINIKDEFGTVTDRLIKKLILIAEEKNISYIVCRNAYNKNYEHIFFPDSDLGIYKSNEYHPLKIESKKTVSARRFVKTYNNINELKFLNKVKRMMTGECINILKAVKKYNEIIDSYYGNEYDEAVELTMKCIEKSFT